MKKLLSIVFALSIPNIVISSDKEEEKKEQSPRCIERLHIVSNVKFIVELFSDNSIQIEKITNGNRDEVFGNKRGWVELELNFKPTKICNAFLDDNGKITIDGEGQANHEKRDLAFRIKLNYDGSFDRTYKGTGVYIAILER